MISFLLSFLTPIIPSKPWLFGLAVLAAAGVAGMGWWSFHSYIKKTCAVEAQNERIAVLEKQLLEANQYTAFLLNAQKKNDNFVKSQKKALKDAKDKDGPVAPVLHNALERLRCDKPDCSDKY